MDLIKILEKNNYKISYKKEDEIIVYDTQKREEYFIVLEPHNTLYTGSLILIISRSSNNDTRIVEDIEEHYKLKKKIRRNYTIQNN
jgi:hypothetical protein